MFSIATIHNKQFVNFVLFFGHLLAYYKSGEASFQPNYFWEGLTAYLKIGIKHSVTFCLTDCSGEDT